MSRVRPWSAALLVSLSMAGACDDSPTAPEPLRDLSGHWRGVVYIPTSPLPTPLEMDLSDVNGTLTGAGGGVDCRYYLTCGYFYRYTVTGSHSATSVTLRGVTPEELSWVLSGTIAADGATMSGYGEGLTTGFPRSYWTCRSIRAGSQRIGLNTSRSRNSRPRRSGWRPAARP